VTEAALAFVVGLLVGGGAAAAVLLRSRRREHETIAAERREADQRRATELAALLEQIRTHFAALSREALSSNTGDFLKLARAQFEQQTAAGDQQLETKKKLIDARLEEVHKRLAELNTVIQNVERERREVHGRLQAGLEKSAQITAALNQTTVQLREALANPQRRGQWGERMAEDILRLVGLVEGVNYEKQSPGAAGDRPDFTFFLPDGRKIHMDVKFPLSNYLKVLEATDDAARDASRALFLRDVRTMIRDVARRPSYVDPASGTLDYVIVFIPNEQIYAFLHEHDRTLIDDALRAKVALCAPMTLYAMLAIIRQAADNFRTARASAQILALLAEFRQQWEKFVESMETVGKRLESAQKAYEDMRGTRTRMLDRRLDRVDDLRVDPALGAPAEHPIDDAVSRPAGEE
jgi:DNA recombination protein RmuC